MILLSILIPTTPDRDSFTDSLVTELISQRNAFCAESVVEIIQFKDNYENSIGFKRNWLLDRANGTHLAFFDSDDKPGPRYITANLEGVHKNVDCCSMRGIIYEKNSPARYFEHSLKYSAYKTTKPDPTGFSDQFYERFPNHLNCIRASIAKQFKFPEINHGEDTDWATQIHNSGLLKTEHYIDDVLYYYTPSDTRK